MTSDAPAQPRVPRPAALLAEADIERLQSLLDQTPAPLEPLDASALDGFLCGVLLQPRPVPEPQWLQWVLDHEGRQPPAGLPGEELLSLLRRRHAEIEHAISRRDWFDPWVFELDESASPSESVLPWLAGFALAMERFPGVMAAGDEALLEPLALLYLHFDPDDLEDADALRDVIDTLEPPDDLAEAIQDIVRSLMLIADVTRPRASRPARPAARRRPLPVRQRPSGPRR